MLWFQIVPLYFFFVVTLGISPLILPWLDLDHRNSNHRKKPLGSTTQIVRTGTSKFSLFPFFRFGYEMLLLIEFFCWVGLDLIRFCFGF